MKITTKEYIDQRVKDLIKYVDANFERDRVAVDKYSETNDEWKTLHNGLQRKMEEDKGTFITRREMWIVITAVLSVISTIVLILLRIYTNK